MSSCSILVSSCIHTALMYEDAFCVSPNAWGGVLNVDTIPRIRAQVVCGACNNQLQFASDAALLAQVCADYMCKSAGQARRLTLLASAAFTMCPTLCATVWALSIAAWRRGNVIHFIHLHFADAKCSLFQVYGNFPGDPMLEQHFDTANPHSIPCTVKRASGHCLVVDVVVARPQSVTSSSKCFQWLRNRASTRTPLQ